MKTKSFKRPVQCILLILMMALLVSCKEKSQLDPDKPTQVTLWHYYAGENQIGLENAVELFNQTLGIEKGVVVNALALGSVNDLEKAITESAKGVLNSMEMPDIFSSYPDKAEEIDRYGLLVDIADYFSSKDLKNFLPEFIEPLYTADKRLTSIPIIKSTELFYINKSQWERFAEDTGSKEEELESWEGLLEIGRKYYEWAGNQVQNNEGAKAFFGVDSLANYIIIGNKQLGVDIIGWDQGGNGRVLLDREVLKKIFNFYYEGYSRGYINYVGRFRSDDLRAGQIASYVGSSSGIAYFPTWILNDDKKIEIELLAKFYPVFEGGSPYAIQQGANMCIVKSDPQKQEGAALFLKWFTSPDNNENFVLTSGYIPVNKISFEEGRFIGALAKLDIKDRVDQNIKSSYEIILEQALERDNYAIIPFEGSYDARKILENSLIEVAEEGREMLSQEKEITVDRAFENWIDRLESSFNEANINYKLLA